MKKIGILINTIKSFQFTNSMILANALKRNGLEVSFCISESVMLNIGKVSALTYEMDEFIQADDELDIESFRFQELNEFDYLWLLSFGKKDTFLDYMQILWSINGQVKFVNSLESLMYFNNKHLLNNYPEVFKHPETHISSDFQVIWDKYSSNSHKKWILKPTAESLGRNVFVLKPNDSNARALIQLMTNGKYCILQEHITEIKNGEKRVIIANGKPICQYLRKNVDSTDHRTNIHQGATAFECELTNEELNLCKKIGDFLKNFGINYVGIDLVFPYVIEFNILNPGGLNTVFDLTNIDYSDKVIKSIMK